MAKLPLMLFVFALNLVLLWIQSALAIWAINTLFPAARLDFNPVTVAAMGLLILCVDVRISVGGGQ